MCSRPLAPACDPPWRLPSLNSEAPLFSPRPRPPSAAAAALGIRRCSVDRPAARARPPAPRGRTRSRRAACRAWRTRSFRCFSPTRRCCTTSTSSQKVGASKPWPQTCASSAATVVGVEPFERERAVGGEHARQRGRAQPLLGDGREAPCRRSRSPRARSCSRRPSSGRRTCAARRDGAW